MQSVKIIKQHGNPSGLPVLTAYVDPDAPGETSDPLYAHYVSVATFAHFVVVSKDNTPFTLSTLAKWLYDNGFTSYTGTYMPCFTVFDIGTPSTPDNTFKLYTSVCVYSSDGTSIKLQQTNNTITYDDGKFTKTSQVQLRDMSTINDTVVEIK